MLLIRFFGPVAPLSVQLITDSKSFYVRLVKTFSLIISFFFLYEQCDKSVRLTNFLLS